MSFPIRAAAVAAAALALAGCTVGPPKAAPVEPEKARTALKTTLDAWKAGRAIDSLAGETPPIVAQDLDWMAGAKLTDYQVVDDGLAQDANLKIRVKLTVRDPQGKTAAKTVTYIVGTDPKVTVFRAME